MKITTNQDNLPLLKEAVTKAKKSIKICSAWIRSSALIPLFSEDVKQRIKSGDISLEVIVRLGEEIDVQITDSRVFDFLNELGAQIKYHPKLHAKMYVVDDTFAMLGSFNLTGGGFGDESRAGGNPETGILTTEQQEVVDVQKRFDQLWEQEATLLDTNLVGFVLNPAAHDRISIVAIGDLEMNRFVEIPIDAQTTLLGKIVESNKYAVDFYNHPDEEAERLFDMQKAFAGNHAITNLAKATASASNVLEQMNIGVVEIQSRIDTITKRRTSNMVPPTVGSRVVGAQPQLLEAIYNQHGFAPAVLRSNPNIKAGFDPFELTTKHMAIFGSTGSGKSYFAKTLLFDHLQQWFCSSDKKGRIVILDPHGEYAQSLQGLSGDTNFQQSENAYKIIDSSDYNLTSRVVQDVDELIEVCEIKPSRSEKQFLNERLNDFFDSKEQKDTVFVDTLRASNQNADSVDYDKDFAHVKESIEKSLPQYLDAFKKIAEAEVLEDIRTGKSPIDLKRTASEIKAEKDELVFAKTLELFNKLEPSLQEQIKKQIIQKNFYDKVEHYFEKEIKLVSDGIINVIEAAIKQNKITFQPLDLMSQMDEAKIYCIDLSNVHEEEVRYELSATILKQAFNDKKEGKGMDTVFVVEEAHNFVPQSTGSGNPASKILQKIAAEGRKFNLGLMIITQRPASVHKGVLNQCSTQAVFRLVNPNDIGAIKESIEGITDQELDMLPKFRQGEGIFTGVAIEESVLIKV